MKNRIHLFELESYKSATQEQRDKMRTSAENYFDLEHLPSEGIRTVFETFIWERGKSLQPASLCSEVLYYNNIRQFLIDRNIKELHPDNKEHILHQIRIWMMENGYKLSAEKYRPEYDKTGYETPGMVNYLKKVFDFLEKDDDRPEIEKDVWELSKLELPLRTNPINRTKSVSFKHIPQIEIREEVKKAIYLELKYEAVSTIGTHFTAINRFTRYLNRVFPNISSLLELEREHIEAYLIYLNTEANERKNFRSDLFSLRSVIEDVGSIYGQNSLHELFLSDDFPISPKYNFRFYSDEEIKRLNEHILKMDEQISRALIIHQLLGTRISDTLTLKTDCLSKRENRYFVRIEQVKSITYEKAVSDEVAQLIMKSLEYTKEHYGATQYIFVSKKDPTQPYQYAMIQSRIMRMIRQEDIRDDNGEYIKFGTHIFRHCYGKKLTEMHVEDWMIARLLGHKTMQSVQYYRKIGNKLMAEETRKSREKMDLILMDIIEGWDGYEI
ncbi:MAG: site-specific integrase [Lachnospiraceae bacterium]|nr:site-specific integrase [Lachnospiraceae bacterium]